MSICIDLNQHVAIVTGANRGIGFAIAQLLSQANATVILIARDPEQLSLAQHAIATETQNKVLSISGDVNDHTALMKKITTVMHEHNLPAIDILINNAGISYRQLPENTADEDWDAVINTNLNSVFKFTKRIYPLLKASSHRGKIINIGSMTSLFGAKLGVAYAASKAGIVQLTKSLAAAWADDIAVNAILPGWIETELTAAGKSVYPEFYAKITERIPEARWGQPQDIAATALWLCSPLSTYTTGAAIPVDGGFSAHLG